jgi:two-component system sensor histidine kinase/response regulator FitF
MPSRPHAGTIPIISVSAESSGELNSKCLEAGINDLISKPVEIEVLHKTIKKYIPG